MTETITTITTEDGAIIGIGEVAYDYYGMGVVELVSIDQHGQFWCCNCPVHDGPDHDTDVRDNYWGTWIPRTTISGLTTTGRTNAGPPPSGNGSGARSPWGGALDGSRVVSVAWAQRKGWVGAADHTDPAPTGWPAWKLPR